MKTLGNRVIKFIEAYCVHSSGDYLGEPFKLRDWQKEIIRELFELKKMDLSNTILHIFHSQKEMEKQNLLELLQFLVF